jgi:hypothetical protein
MSQSCSRRGTIRFCTSGVLGKVSEGQRSVLVFLSLVYVRVCVTDSVSAGVNFTVSERQNTLVSAFDLRSPCISASEIHELIYEHVSLNDQEVTMVQIDGSKRGVYIKFRVNERTQDVVQSTGGQLEYRRTNGELSTVRINTAGRDCREYIVLTSLQKCRMVDYGLYYPDMGQKRYSGGNMV